MGKGRNKILNTELHTLLSKEYTGNINSTHNKYELSPYLEVRFFSLITFIVSEPSTSTRVCILSCFSHVQLFATPWTVAHQAPLSMGFSRQENWSGLRFSLPFPCLPPGDLPSSGIKPASLVFRTGRWVLYH